jgi:hypothetical protein
MSKFHKITIDEEVFIVRDVPIPPFSKKFRVAPTELKYKIIEKLNKKENLLHLKYVNSRIHFYINNLYIIKKEDDELAEYLQNNIQHRNDIII